MSKNYDNWDKLVGAVLRREQLRQIALSHSRDASNASDLSSSSSFSSTSLFHHHLLVYKGQNPPPVASYFDTTDSGSSSERSVPLYNRKLISRSVPGKCIFLPVEARELTISSVDFPAIHFGYSTRVHFDSRFEAVEVNSVLSLDIRGKIKTRLLTPNTIYGAYLLFTSAEKLEGLDSAEAVVRFVDSETDGDAERRAETVHLQPVDKIKGVMAVEREDGWLEVQIGNFYIDVGDDDEVEARVMEASRWKTGLIVGGIEFRPLVGVKII